MPWIENSRRRDFELELDALHQSVRNVGELTYVLFKICQDYYKKNPKYATIAEIEGAIHRMSKDLDYIHFRPYEEIKRRENGDVL